MKNCPPEEKLGAWVDGELPAGELAAIEAHVRTCASCAETAAAYRKLDGLAGALAAPAVSDEEWGATWAAIESRVALKRAQARPAVWHRRIAWLTAAAACLAIAVGALLHTGGPPAEQARECVVEDVEAGPGYSASVSYSQDADVMLITVSPVASEEAPSNAPSGDAL